ncbi:Verru_Chthon cassette protein C [Terrimicrobium sacchariphilum]|uniref:Verru_Chthon cassette protein C n=2 Tax=Terrimicrobium sacchariphilum TaxID=690879 RepID=A0A146G7A1_TERSA|nr:Verru_Chthon cassette protein C [Terrimicrobium sacchariphilum]
MNDSWIPANEAGRAKAMDQALVTTDELPTMLTRLDRRGRRSLRGFSLLEMLAASAVFLLLIGLVLKMTQATADSWSSSTGKTEGFRDARAAFATITKAVSQATLNPYFDYADAGGNFRDQVSSASFTPTQYIRRSDLQFITGKSLVDAGVQNPVSHAIFFLAPLGYSLEANYRNMDGFLNACGFYVFYGEDPAMPARLSGAIPASRNRFRLMQFLQPTENLSIYDVSVTGGSANWRNTKWFGSALARNSAPVSQLAENVVALVIRPKASDADEAKATATLAPDYEYDSRDPASAESVNQLPPVVEIVMVVIDDTSAQRLGNETTPPNLGLNNLFQDASRLDADLSELEKNLGAINGNAAGNKIPLRYQIFRTEVALRSAKWSSQ